ncbi:hypothetical protein BDZ85DRAFT_285844 [Elsinoe ampelina]|uniref:Uncharacterized protein n=1 Tax=Elsinoe ampelina TaxID=302913 RepID=A0A6A6FZU8_9PEZI|nr:hypothetical protein BDZ85DRAFT_285844 [Elsinoe ampelina]
MDVAYTRPSITVDEQSVRRALGHAASTSLRGLTDTYIGPVDGDRYNDIAKNDDRRERRMTKVADPTSQPSKTSSDRLATGEAEAYFKSNKDELLKMLTFKNVTRESEPTNLIPAAQAAAKLGSRQPLANLDAKKHIKAPGPAKKATSKAQSNRKPDSDSQTLSAEERQRYKCIDPSILNDGEQAMVNDAEASDIVALATGQIDHYENELFVSILDEEYQQLSENVHGLTDIDSNVKDMLAFINFYSKYNTINNSHFAAEWLKVKKDEKQEP